jgi:hypothetical protein
MGHEHDNMPELTIADNGHVDWATEMEETMDLTIEGKYIPANYPPTPSFAPWHPPKSKSAPPQTHYTPPHVWYNPPTHLQHISTPPVPPLHPSPTCTMFLFQKPNVSCDHDATRLISNNNIRCGHRGTSLCASSHSTMSEGPSHAPTNIPKCLDSPDWCTPSPNCLISFQSPSPPPQSPHALPVSLLDPCKCALYPTLSLTSSLSSSQLSRPLQKPCRKLFKLLRG